MKNFHKKQIFRKMMEKKLKKIFLLFHPFNGNNTRRTKREKERKKAMREYPKNSIYTSFNRYADSEPDSLYRWMQFQSTLIRWYILNWMLSTHSLSRPFCLPSRLFTRTLDPIQIYVTRWPWLLHCCGESQILTYPSRHYNEKNSRRLPWNLTPQ